MALLFPETSSASRRTSTGPCCVSARGWNSSTSRRRIAIERQEALRIEEGVKVAHFFGNPPALDNIAKALLTCAFHWYAVSACQYVRTVGAIAWRLDPSSPLPMRYVENLIPEVLAFRNKVAAHFAWSTQNKNDNDAERLASILPPLSFIGGSFHVGTMSTYIRRGEVSSTSDSIRPWSISAVHAKLRERYWPLRGTIQPEATSDDPGP